MVPPHDGGQGPLDHRLQVRLGFGYGLLTPAIPATAFIQLFLDVLYSPASFCRGAQHKVNREEAVAIRPSQRQQFEALEPAVAVVVKNPGKQLYHLGPRAVIGGIVKDQHLLAIFAGQQIKKPDDCCHQRQHELRPVVPGIVWYCPLEPFLFDIIRFFADPNIPESERLFILICNYFSRLDMFSMLVAPTQKLETFNFTPTPLIRTFVGRAADLWL